MKKITRQDFIRKCTLPLGIFALSSISPQIYALDSASSNDENTSSTQLTTDNYNLEDLLVDMSRSSLAPTVCCFSSMTRSCSTSLIFAFSGLSSFIQFEDDLCFSEILASSTNPSVATFIEPGRIYALSQGTTTITLQYRDFSTNYDITVENNISDEITNVLFNNGDLQNIINTNIQPRSISRSTMAQKALAMYNTTWTPEQDYLKWSGGYFPAGVAVQGIPYTQWAQKDENTFLEAMSRSDFYSIATSTSGKNMPRFGNDCSGFVSFCWELDRLSTTGFASNLQSGIFSEITNWDNFYIGDALLRTSYNNHIIMCYDIIRTGPGVIVAYEQTPDKVTYSVFYYDQLLNDNYIRISYFT